MDWQPIETAPKDGTEIIGYFPDFNRPIRFTHWIETEQREYGKVIRTTAEWYEHHWDFTGDMPKPQPTHWMPVPEKPQ